VIVDSAMTDHPSWSERDGGGFVRAVRSGSSVWLLSAEPTEHGRYELTATGLGAPFDPQHELTIIDPAGLTGTDEIVRELHQAGARPWAGAVRQHEPDATTGLSCLPGRSGVRWLPFRR
jgi:hypothetical protein